MESEKPDGWVAWHPVRCRRHRVVGSQWAAWNRGIFCKSINLRDLTRKQSILKLKKEGWRIRPVKLVFLDEEPK